MGCKLKKKKNTEKMHSRKLCERTRANCLSFSFGKEKKKSKIARLRKEWEILCPFQMKEFQFAFLAQWNKCGVIYSQLFTTHWWNKRFICFFIVNARNRMQLFSNDSVNRFGQAIWLMARQNNGMKKKANKRY